LHKIVSPPWMEVNPTRINTLNNGFKNLFILMGLC